MRRLLAPILLLAAAVATGGDETPRAADGHEGFAGTESCVGCHKKETDLWKASTHGLHATPRGKPEGGFSGAVGSVWMQAYVREDRLGYHRIVPVCLDLRENKWREVMPILDEIRGEWPGAAPTTPESLAKRTFEVDCSGCHSSQSWMRIDPATGKMNSSWDLAINCEACHGPGAAHVAAWRKLNRDAPMVRLEKLSPREANAVCARCHAGPPAQGDFAPKDAKHYIATLDDRQGYFADGAASGQVYQYATFVRSACYLEGGLTCVGCHDSHGPGLRHQEHADAICTRCHEGEYATRKHTFHDPRGAGARCIECHLPRLLKGVLRHQRDHRIASPVPASPYVPDACTACHGDKTKEWADKAYRQWWGEPPKETVDAIRAIHLARRDDPRAEPLLRRALRHSDAFFRANAAIYLEDPNPILEDPVPEVRLAAVRAATTKEQLKKLAQDAEPRVRAAAVLELVEQGAQLDPAWAADLEITARQIRDLALPRIILGVLAMNAGEPARAQRHFESALGARPGASDAWLGLATSLERQNKPDEAREAHRRLAFLLREMLLKNPMDVELGVSAARAFLKAGLRDRALEIQRRTPSEETRRRIRRLLEGR